MDPARHAWAGTASYDQLLANSDRPSGRSVVLTFHTPTAFSSNVRNVAKLFPEPDLVFRSLAMRWNAYAGSDRAIAPVRLDALCWALRVTRYSLVTRTVRLAPRVTTKGFVGSCAYSLGSRAPADCRQALRLLAEFAFFTGVGLRSTMGMGQVTLASRSGRCFRLSNGST